MSVLSNWSVFVMRSEQVVWSAASFSVKTETSRRMASSARLTIMVVLFVVFGMTDTGTFVMVMFVCGGVVVVRNTIASIFQCALEISHDSDHCAR